MGVKKLEQAVRSSRYIPDNIRRMEIWSIPHLGSQLIAAIDDKAIAEYINWRVNRPKKPPAISTLRNERTVLIQIFQFAKSRGYRTDIPLFRLPSSRQNARNDIPEAEWKALGSYLSKYVAQARDRRRHRERFYLQHYILILGNSGIRVGEARTLRWGDISETRTTGGNARVVFRVKGKTGAREVVCNRDVAKYLQRLRDFRTAEVGAVKLDEPIFCHPNGLPVGSYKGGFEKVLDGAGILNGPDGKPRVPYSLRHTYATMRLAEGVGVYHLAVNMGTSVKMIEDYYGKRRVNPKMTDELTKLRQPPNARYLTPHLLRRMEGKHSIKP
jgi:integrase